MHRKSRIIGLMVALSLAPMALSQRTAFAQAKGTARKPVDKKKQPEKTKTEPTVEPSATAPSSSAAPPPEASSPPPPPPAPTVQPSAQAPSSSPASPTSEPRPASPGQWKRTAGYVSIGSSVALGGLGLLFHYLDVKQNKDGYERYARTVPKGESVCEAAKAGHEAGDPLAYTSRGIRNICNRGKRYTIAQITSYGLGAVALGLGVYFLVTAPPKRETAWVLVPNTRGLDVIGRF